MDPKQNVKADDSGVPEYIEEVERDLLKVIVDNMEHRGMTLEQAHLLAKEFLTLLPPADKKDLLHKLKGFSKEHPETKPVVNNFNRIYQLTKDQETLEQMRQHLQKGNIEKAIEVAKGDKK